MAESLFQELKRYVDFNEADERALRALHPLAEPYFVEISSTFYKRILEHDGARIALEGGESQVGRLKVTLVAWMDKLLSGPWDEEYFQLRCRIGRVHVRIALPQHYMFGAMNVVRQELNAIIDRYYLATPELLEDARRAVGKVLDLELAIMLHTYREDLLDQNARSERLATFGQLVGSIGHELRNPLGVIETSLYILRNRQGQDERAGKHLNRIGEQVGIANQIIGDLLDLIRDKPLARERVDLATLLDSAMSQLNRSPSIRFEVLGLEPGTEVAGDASQLRQVFVNLLENALHAALPEGWVRVEVSTTSDALLVAVEDSGAGVSPDVKRRLFEPLITTKEKGIGLGLALVRRILQRHGGDITLDSPPGKGARFTVRLPRS